MWSTAFSTPPCDIRGITVSSRTRSLGDGDPCDVLVANTRAIVPGAIVSVRPVGVLLMDDDGGADEKIIAVPTTKLTRRYEKVASYKDLPSITIEQIEHFFAHYKDFGAWQMGKDPTLGRPR